MSNRNEESNKKNSYPPREKCEDKRAVLFNNYDSVLLNGLTFGRVRLLTKKPQVHKGRSASPICNLDK